MDYRGWLHRRHLDRDPGLADHAPDLPPERNLTFVLIAASLALFVVQLDFFALNLSLPAMARELDVSTTALQWVISGYMLALAAFLIPCGRLGDLLGRKRTLVAGLVLFGLTSLAGGLAPNAEVLIACRIVQGVSSAILFPVSIAVVSNAFPPDRQMRAIGNAYGLSAIATALGPFVGGGLTELIDWRAVLLINVPLALFAMWLVLRSVEESRDEAAPPNVDLPGLALVVAGIAAVTYAVDRAAEWGIGSAEALGLLAVGLALLVGFVLRERAARYPLVDLKLFANRRYVGITLLGTVANVAFVVTTFSVTLYLQQVEGYSAFEAGLIFVCASIPLALAGPAAGWIGEHLDVARAMVVASAAGAVGLVLLAAGLGLGPYMLGLALFGGGYGLGWSMASVGTQAVVPANVAGQASGITLGLVIGLGGLGVAVAAAIIQGQTSSGGELGATIESLLRVVAVASVLGSLALLLYTARGARSG